MKISKSYLIQIIKEELTEVLSQTNNVSTLIKSLSIPPDLKGMVVDYLNTLERLLGANNDEEKDLYDDLKDVPKEDLQSFLGSWISRTERLISDGEFGSMYESKKKNNEGLSYHIANKTPLTENVYRVGSDAYFDLIKEARVQYKKGNYTPLNEEEKEMLESDLGEWATFRGERVPLDFPMYTETLDERKKKKKKKKDPPIGKPMKNAGGGKKYQVYVRSKKTGRIKKISYGDSKGGLKGNWNSAEARKSFASRHQCAKKKDRTKAGYWACRAHKDFGTNVPGRFW